MLKASHLVAPYKQKIRMVSTHWKLACLIKSRKWQCMMMRNRDITSSCVAKFPIVLYWYLEGKSTNDIAL